MALTELYGPECRHDQTRDRVLGLLRLGKQGEQGVKAALQALQEAFANVVGPERPEGRDEALYEFRKFIYKKVDDVWVVSEEVAKLLAESDYDDWVRNLGEPPPDADDHHTGEWSPNGDQEHVDQERVDQRPPDHHESAVQHRLDVLRINSEAKRRLDEESRPPIVLPPIKSLGALLAEPHKPTRYRIEGLAPENSRNMLSAQYKAGKTAIVDNLVRSLVDSEPFLGRFTVNTLAHHVVLIDDELSTNIRICCGACDPFSTPSAWTRTATPDGSWSRSTPCSPTPASPTH